MSGTKRLLCFLVCVLLAVPALADTTLISQEDIEQDSANYKTADVESGVLSKTVTTSASVFRRWVSVVRVPTTEG